MLTRQRVRCQAVIFEDDNSIQFQKESSASVQRSKPEGVNDPSFIGGCAFDTQFFFDHAPTTHSTVSFSELLTAQS